MFDDLLKHRQAFGLSASYHDEKWHRDVHSYSIVGICHCGAAEGKVHGFKSCVARRSIGGGL